MSPLGAVLRAIQEIPRELLRDASASAGDYRLVADALNHAERQVRALGECRPETIVQRLTVASTKALGRGRL